jgi:hypothetical protein
LAAVFVAVLAVLGVAVPVMAAGGAGAATAPYCGIRWGSLPKSVPGMTGAPVVNVRAGRHSCYDRLVVDLAGPAAGYTVEYVSQVRTDPADMPVALRGGAFLNIVVRAPANTVDGTPTYSPANRNEVVNVSGFRTFRQAAMTGNFEGITSFGLGVRARLPFRVFVLSGPGSGSRIVIDVAHRWS